MDLMILARKACLSVGQVRELESGKDGRYFYSETIKRQAYKRVLQVLGVTPPHEAPETDAKAISDDDARLDTLDQIAAMSHRPTLNRPLFSVFRVAIDRLQQHKQIAGASLLLLLALSGLVSYGTQRATENKPDEVVHTTTQTVATPPTPVLTTASTPISLEVKSQPITTETTCAFSTEDMPQLSVLQAHKEGRYVYLVSTTHTQVCVVDAYKRATMLQMKAGESQSVYGAAPWQISSSNLSQVKIYFQGRLVALPEGAPQRLSLIEASVTR